MLGKKETSIQVKVWENVNCPHNEMREKDMLKKLK